MTQSKIKATLFALATLGCAMGVVAGAEARIVTADTFFATYGEMKRICKRYDHSIWKTQDFYGCGPARCDAKTHKCYARFVPPPRREHPNCPPTINCAPGKKNPNGDDHHPNGGGGKPDGGRPGGGQTGGGPEGAAGDKPR